jgi:hypothetical protein
MLDPRKAAEFEQSIAFLSDHLPRLWWSMYRSCLTTGFSSPQAMALLQTYILATNSSKIYGIAPDDGGKREDSD